MTTTPVVPTTLLQAVNAMLDAVGQAHVMSLANTDTNEEAQRALSRLSDTCLSVQSEAWHCNSEEDFALDPNPTTGEIAVPHNTVRLRVSDRSRRRDLTQRGQRLYDRGAHTYNIGETVYVDVVLALPFEELPQSLRWYVLAKAARLFATGRVPSMDTFRFTNAEEEAAYSRALQEDQDARSFRVTESNAHFRAQRRRGTGSSVSAAAQGA